MASPRNLALQFVIKAKDSATGVFKALFGYLDSEISVTAGKVRDAFSNLFGGGLDGAIEFEAQLDRVGAFAYSPVDGAAANALPGALPKEMREERRRRLMELQEDISADLLAAKIGREIDVLVDEVDDEGTIARSAADAPEIDGLVFVNDYFDAEPGDFLRVRVLDADEHDLYAEVVAEAA